MLFGDGFPDFFDIVSWKIIVLIIVICILRAWLKGTQFKERNSVKGLVAVVTGANCGIGKQIVRDLNGRGAKVYMLCRDKDKGMKAKEELLNLGCNPERMILLQVDLTSFESVRKCAKEIKQDEERVDILINNAGVMLYPKFKLTEDGHELTWQTNYLSHFLLTELLIPLLSKSQVGGRIINVSALAHNHCDGLDLNAIDRRDRWDSRQSYARSKIAMVLHARELCRRLRRQELNVTVNACHPGLCYTRIMRHTPLMTSPLVKYPLTPFAWFLLKTPKDGAQTPLCLALSKKLDGTSGKYYSDCHEKETSELANDTKMAEELYNYSLQTTSTNE